MTSVDTLHAFDEALSLSGTGDVRKGRTTPAYANMVGPFGGITAAVILRAIEQHPDVLGEPVSLTTNFLGAIADGEFDVSVRPVRTNRTTQHWSVEVTQDGIPTTTATAVFGIRRPKWSDTEIAFPKAPDADDVAVQAFPDAIAWARNYEMRFVDGGLAELDGSANADSVTTQWIRDYPNRDLDFAALTAMSDAFYPRVFRRFGTMAPAGTVSLTTYFHADAATLAAHGSAFVLGVAKAQHFGTGFFDQTAQLWGTDEQLLATSHQVVYFKG